jgi:hypothetical protein
MGNSRENYNLEQVIQGNIEVLETPLEDLKSPGS